MRQLIVVSLTTPQKTACVVGVHSTRGAAERASSLGERLSVEIQASELTDFPVICLLGAAGLGKTHELSVVANLERAKQKRVVFASLGALATDATGLRLEIETLSINAGMDTVLILDSLDEAMVPVPYVGNVLSNWIGRSLGGKPSLRIACRSTVWPSFLIAALENVYGRDQVRTVELLPLDRTDIRVAAEAEEINPQIFLKAINEANAFSLATRPLTLQLLIDEFRTSGKVEIGKHFELFSRAVQRLCADPVERRERRTARLMNVEASVKLAAEVSTILLLCGCESIDKSGAVASRPGVMDLARFESLGFSIQELQNLFESGLFTSDSPNNVRFIHRQIAEFLAGRRVSTLPIQQVRSILSQDGGHDSRVAGQLQEIAAWAAGMNPEVADWVARTDPELIGRSEITSEQLRRKAFQAVLEMFRAGRLTEAQIHQDEGLTAGFRYDGIENALRSVLEERGSGLEDVHAFAIKIAEKNNFTKLSAELANIALDSTLPLSTRTHAAHSVAQLGNEESKRAIKPLAYGVPEDVRDDLKGVALSVNWPAQMTDAELFSSLTAPKTGNYLGPYKLFLWMMAEGGLPLPNIDAGSLRWACSIGRKGGIDDPLTNVAGYLAYQALDMAHQPEICEQLADRVLRAGRTGAHPFYLHRRSKELLNTYDMEAIGARFEKDAELRRSLTGQIAYSATSEIDLFQSMRSVPNLFDIKDFPWLLEMAKSASPAAAANFARIATWLPWSKDEKCFELLHANLSIPAIAQHFPPMSILLNSEAAQREREYQRLLKESEERQVQPVVNSAEQVSYFLAKCAEDPRWFEAMSEALTLDDNGRQAHDRFISRTEGWKHADALTRSTILEVAKRVILECADLSHHIKKEPLSTIPMDGVMNSFFLLVELDATFLAALGTELWRIWAWYIMREVRFHLNHEPLAPKKALMTMVHRFQPELVLQKLGQVARNPAGVSTLGSLLESLEEIEDKNLDAALCSLVTSQAVRGENLSLIMFATLRRSPGNGMRVCLRRLSQNAKGHIGMPAIMAAVALLKELPTQSCEQVFSVFDRRPEISRNALGQLAHIPGTEMKWLLSLNEQQQGHLLELLFSAFPPKSDAQHEGAHFVGPADSGAFLRDRLLSLVSNQGTATAVATLRRLETKLRHEYPWLRFPRADAERAERLRMWTPLDLKEMSWLLKDGAARLLRSEDDLVVLICEALRRFQKSLDGPPPLSQNLWNTPYREPPTPKKEEAVSDNLLQMDLRSG